MQPNALNKVEARFRALALGLLAIAGLGLRFVPPEWLAWWPFRVSCGAVSGLPCIFCGMTRALHHFCRGEFERALYFNWLVFPFVVLVVVVASQFALELSLRRKVHRPLLSWRMTPRSLGVGLAVLVLLWVMQITIAVRLDKRELLNPRGPLYALFVH